GRGADVLVPEGRVAPVVVAVQLHRLVGRRIGVGCGPAGGQVQPLAAEDPEDVRLGRGAVHVVLGAPVVLGDAGLGPWGVGRPPALHAGDQLHGVVDPGLVDVVRVPQAAGGAVAQELHA